MHVGSRPLAASLCRLMQNGVTNAFGAVNFMDYGNRCKRCSSNASSGWRQQSSRSSSRWLASGKQLPPSSRLPGEQGLNTLYIRASQTDVAVREPAMCKFHQGKENCVYDESRHDAYHAAELRHSRGSRKLWRPASRWMRTPKPQRCTHSNTR